MNDYIVSLALAYFKEKRGNYSIGELMEMLGYNNTQIDNLISTLLDNNYICYMNDLLSITGEGIKFLIINNQDEACFRAESFITPHIDPKSAVPLDAPYVPEKFVKKFKG